MGRVCKELELTFKSGVTEDIRTFFNQYEYDAAEICVDEQNQKLYIYDLYRNPTDVIADFVKNYGAVQFEAEAHMLSESSGERLDCQYVYDGELKTTESGWYDAEEYF